MKWWLIVFLLTANGWEPGENFDGWWASKQASFEACVEHRDFANKVNADTSLATRSVLPAKSASTTARHPIRLATDLASPAKRTKRMCQ